MAEDKLEEFIKSLDDMESIYFRPVPNNADKPMTFSEIQLELGSTATPYEPYSNICPISGWSEANVCRTAGNIWSSDWVINCRLNGQTSLIGSDGQSRTVYMPVEAGKTYVIHKIKSARFRVAFTKVLPADGVTIYNFENLDSLFSGDVNYQFTVPAEMTYFAAQVVYTQRDTASTVLASVTIGEGTSVTVDLGGTRYGGALDVLTGVLKVTKDNIASYAGETLPGAWISDRDVYAPGTTPTTGAQVVYDLASELTVQLTASEISSLIGENNIWCDTGGTAVTIQLAAGDLAFQDVVDYETQVINKPDGMITDTEDAMTASRNYTAGEFLICGNKMYKVTANIANGGTITEGTNVQETTVAEQLVLLFSLV